jgi:hypothetical protein
MSTIAHPVQNAADWGRVLIGGSVLPGVLEEITVPPRIWNWAKNRGFGQSIVTVFQSTDILDEIKFRHFLNLKTTGADDWALLETFLRVLLPGWPDKYVQKPRSLPIVHPAVQFLGGKRVHLTKIWAPIPPPGEKIPQYYEIAVQEDVPDKRPPTGPAEPAQLNGVPKPKDLQDLANLQALADFKGISLAQLTVSPPGPTDPAAIATGKASK